MPDLIYQDRSYFFYFFAKVDEIAKGTRKLLKTRNNGRLLFRNGCKRKKEG